MAQITENPARVGARNRAGNNLNGSSYIIDFRSINQAAVPALPAILARLLPGGKISGGEYVALNPTRADHRPGSFKINLRSGHWADFACGDRGGDPVSLVAYLENVSQGEAARMLARMLGLETGGRRNE
jgi:CHC2 zinc finger